MQFDAITMRTLHKRVMPQLDLVSYTAERAYWYTRRERLGTRSMQELEAILYGEIEMAAARVLKILKEYIDLDKIIEVLVLHKCFPAFNERIYEIGAMLDEVTDVLRDRPIKLKRFNRSKIPELYQMLCLHRDVYDEIIHQVAEGVRWEDYRLENDAVNQDLELEVDALDLLRDLA